MTMTPKDAALNRPKRLLPLWEGRFLLLATGFALTLLTAALLIASPLLVQQAELRLYDQMLAGRTVPPQSGVPVLVGIDEESLAAFGQWPWPRYRLARLVERLHLLGAKVVTLDFLMPEPDRTSPEMISSERHRDLAKMVLRPDQSGEDGNSRLLARAMSKGDTVLGYFLQFGHDSKQTTSANPVVPVLPPGMVVTSNTGSIASWPRPNDMIHSLPLLTGAVRAEGFTNALHDRDGALRRVPLLLPYDGKLYPSLALATLLLNEADRTIHIEQEMVETTLVWGRQRIPLDHEGNMLLDFRAEKHPFPYLSARAVLAGESLPVEIKGKLVLVGPWAKGLGDQHLVPSGHSISGLAIHATVIDNILAGTHINRPGWSRGAELFAVLLLGIMSTWLFSQPGFFLSLVTVLFGTSGCYWGGREMLVAKGVYLSPLMPMLTPVLIMTVLSLLKYGIEARKVRQRTQDLIEAQDTIIFGMSALTATRDKETGGHIQRTRLYVETLARHLSTLPKYASLDDTAIELLAKSAPLHDIGKVGIPDSILHKPGELSEQEYATMKNHTLIGVHALTRTIDGSNHPERHDFLQYARQMIESHHERWDGTGYPHGLQGEEIPLAGRLMALADAYDAMVSRRVYKQEYPHAYALEYIQSNSGKHFDPDVVAAFLARNDDFLRIARECTEDGEEGASLS